MFAEPTEDWERCPQRALPYYLKHEMEVTFRISRNKLAILIRLIQGVDDPVLSAMLPGIMNMWNKNKQFLENMPKLIKYCESQASRFGKLCEFGDKNDQLYLRGPLLPKEGE